MTFHHLTAAELHRHISNFEADRPNWDMDDRRTYRKLLEALAFQTQNRRSTKEVMT